MEVFNIFPCLVVLVACVAGQADEDAPCFEFNGDAYLRFSLGNFNNDGPAHYSLQFQTSADNGLLLYAAGRHGDDEALFIRDGRIAYHLFNTSPTSVEGYFGGYFESDVLVNTNEWVTVHLYRNWEVLDHGNRRKRNQTGIVLEINNVEYSYVDYRTREDISILPDVYVGGYRDRLSDTVGNFNGLISDLREHKNGRLFEYPTLNFASRVKLDCLGTFVPN